MLWWKSTNASAQYSFATAVWHMKPIAITIPTHFYTISSYHPLPLEVPIKLVIILFFCISIYIVSYNTFIIRMLSNTFCHIWVSNVRNHDAITLGILMCFSISTMHLQKASQRILDLSYSCLASLSCLTKEEKSKHSLLLCKSFKPFLQKSLYKSEYALIKYSYHPVITTLKK